MRAYFLIVGIMLWSTSSYSQVLFGEVWIEHIETIEIVNHGDRDQDLSGWSLQSTSGTLDNASQPKIWFFPTETVIKAHNLVNIFWNASGGDSPNRLYTESGFNLLDSAAGDLALVSPEGIEHYLQWGAAGQGLEAVAVAAGKWMAGEFLESFGEGGCCEAWGYGYLFDPSGEEISWVHMHAINSAVLIQTWGFLKGEFQQ